MKRHIFMPILLVVSIFISGCSGFQNKKAFGLNEEATVLDDGSIYSLTLKEFDPPDSIIHIEAIKGETHISDRYHVYVNGEERDCTLLSKTSGILEGYSADVDLFIEGFIDDGDDIAIIYYYTGGKSVRFELTYRRDKKEKDDTEEDEDSKEVQHLDEILEEQQQDDGLPSAATDNGIVLDGIFGTYVDSGNGLTFVISSPNEIIRIQNGNTYTDKIVGVKEIEYDHTTIGLHIMAKGDGQELNYMSYGEGTILSLSSRCGWEEDDLQHVAAEAQRVSN